MKIVIDARESGTSTGRYIDNLVAHLYKLQPAHDFTILTKPHRVDYMASAAPNYTILESSYKEFTFQEQIGLLRQINKLRPDLVHFAKDHQPVCYRGKTVTSMLDLTTMRFTNPDKQHLVFKLKQLVYKWVVKRVARRSTAIVTISEYVKQDIVDYAGVPGDKITVTHLAADMISDSPVSVSSVGDKKFLMYVGRPTPHKNLERLIQAFKELKGQHPNLHLVLAGKVDANYRTIQQNVQTEQITNIIFTDLISDGQLRWLYEHCEAFVFPSLSEGFGLPGLEAMVHGAPVVSSNATCLPEVYGQAAHYFDPIDVQAMTDAINEVITDKELRQKLIEAGRAQAAKYSWQRTAEQTVAVYNNVLKP